MRAVAVIGAAVIVAGVWYATSRDTTNQNNEEVIGVSSEDQVIEAGTFERDSDNDGLKDWEEALWETDPSNPDTDSDGASDGEEVEAGRDPTVSGPNDTIAQTDIPIYAREESTLTTSESFQKDFFEQLTEANRQGNVTETELQEMLAQLTGEYSRDTDSFSFYTETDIAVEDTTRTTVRTYLNSLGELTQKYRDTFTSDKLVSIQRIFTEPEAVQENDFNSLVDDFAAAEGELAKLSVPRSLVSAHSDLLNSVAAMRTALETILETHSSDPLRAIIEMNSFTSGLVLFGEAIEEIKTYMQSSDVSFSEDDSARVLLDL